MHQPGALPRGGRSRLGDDLTSNSIHTRDNVRPKEGPTTKRCCSDSYARGNRPTQWRHRGSGIVPSHAPLVWLFGTSRPQIVWTAPASTACQRESSRRPESRRSEKESRTDSMAVSLPPSMGYSDVTQTRLREVTKQRPPHLLSTDQPTRNGPPVPPPEGTVPAVGSDPGPGGLDPACLSSPRPFQQLPGRVVRRRTRNGPAVAGPKRWAVLSRPRTPPKGHRREHALTSFLGVTGADNHPIGLFV